jgi:hypothetical protein
MTREAQRQLYHALEAHTSALQDGRSVTSGRDLEALNRRIEAARLLLEWLSQALEPQPPVSPAAQTPPPSSSPADQGQIPPSASDPPKTSPS